MAAATKKDLMPFDGEQWLNDEQLTKCRPSTRGIWMDLICRMYASKTQDTICGTSQQLANYARCDHEAMEAALDDLEDTGTADIRREQTGRAVKFIVTCRRLGRMAQKKGAPKEERHLDPSTTWDKPVPKTNEPFKAEEVLLPESLGKSPQFRAAWLDWCKFRKSRRKTISPIAAKQQLKDLESIGPEDSVSLIRKAIASDWQGLHIEALQPIRGNGGGVRKTVGDKNQDSASKVSEVLNARQGRNAEELLRFPPNTDESRGNARLA